jgi:hypothetical protein
MNTAAAHSRLPMALADLAFQEYHSAQIPGLAGALADSPR